MIHYWLRKLADNLEEKAKALDERYHAETFEAHEMLVSMGLASKPVAYRESRDARTLRTLAEALREVAGE